MTKLKAIFIFTIALVSTIANAQTMNYSSSQKFDSSSVKGVRYFKPVLLNFLYRSGGPGGQVPLNAAGLKSLCEAGFTSAHYLYPTNMGENKKINCETNGVANQLDYKVSSFRGDGVETVFAEIHKQILNNDGPALVHCWNGWHASGEIAAYALMQFCDWSGNEAAKYWADNIQDKGNLPKYGSIQNRVRNFKPYAKYRLDPATQNNICPNK